MAAVEPTQQQPSHHGMPMYLCSASATVQDVQHIALQT
jgi:hypothetical protein